LRRLLEQLNPNDYYRPLNGRIHQLIAQMADERTPVDVRTLTARVVSSGLMNQTDAFDYVYGIGNAVPSAAAADWYMRPVINRAQRRGLIELGERAIQAGMEAPDDDDPTALVEQVTGWFRELRDRASLSGAEAVDLHQFLDVRESYDWLIPGLLER